MKIYFDVKNQIITRTDRNQVIANSADYLEAEITFSAEWATMEKTMTFKNGNLLYTYVLVNDKILEENHLNLGVGTWKVSIQGVNEDKKIVTNECNLAVNASGWIGSEALPPESIWNQLLVIIQSLHTEVASTAALRSAVQKYIEDNYDALVKEAVIVDDVRAALDDMAEDGTLSDLLAPLVAAGMPEVVADQISAVVAAQIGGVVSNQIGAVVASQITTPVNQAVKNYCDDNFSGWSGALDRGLAQPLMAAPADMVGEIKSALTNVEDVVFTQNKTTLVPDNVISKAYIALTGEIGFQNANSYKVAIYPVTAGKYRIFGAYSSTATLGYSASLPEIGSFVTVLVGNGSGTLDTIIDIVADGYIVTDYKLTLDNFLQSVTIDNIRNDLDAVKDDMYEGQYRELEGTALSGLYINSDGVVTSGSTVTYKYYEITAGKYKFVGDGSGSQNYPSIVFDKSTPEVGDRTIILDKSASAINEEITIAEDGYIIAHSSFLVSLYDVDTKLDNYIKSNEKIEYTLMTPNGQVNKSYIAGSTNKITTASGNAYKTYYYSVTAGKYKINGIKPIGTYFLVAGFTESTPEVGVELSIIPITGTDGEPFEKEFTISSSGYLVTDGQSVYNVTAYSGEIVDVTEYIQTEVDEIYSAVGKVDNVDKTTLPNENPIEVITKSVGMSPILTDWGFIGDSLSSGAMNGNNTGQAEVPDLYAFSWGQFLCRLCGNEGYNFSYGGATAKHWLNSNNARAWGGASQNPKKCYSIALGVNDGVQMASIYPNGVGDVSSDIDIEDYANNDYDTFIGNIGGIIQRLKSIQPNCIIFVWTMPQGDTSTGHEYHESMAEEVKKLPTIFSNVYVIDLWDYAIPFTSESYPWGLRYKNEYHLTPAGYLYLAYLFANYTDWHIRHNYQAFKDCAFIGSETTTYTAYIISGTVKDGNNAPIANAFVSITGSKGQFYAKTNASGEYRIPTIKAGSYTLYVSASGYTASSESITVSQTETKNIVLS